MLSVFEANDFRAVRRIAGFIPLSGMSSLFLLVGRHASKLYSILIFASPLVFRVNILLLDSHYSKGRSWSSEFLVSLCLSLPLGRKLNNHRLDPAVGPFGRNCLTLCRLLLFFTSFMEVGRTPRFCGLWFFFLASWGWVALDVGFHEENRARLLMLDRMGEIGSGLS